MSEAQSFLVEIEKFLVRTGMTPAAFGKRTANDGKFVDRLRRGGQVTLGTAERIREFIAGYEVPRERRRRVA
jgi:hypothetical protein